MRDSASCLDVKFRSFEVRSGALSYLGNDFQSIEGQSSIADSMFES